MGNSRAFRRRLTEPGSAPALGATTDGAGLRPPVLNIRWPAAVKADTVPLPGGEDMPARWANPAVMAAELNQAMADIEAGGGTVPDAPPPAQTDDPRGMTRRRGQGSPRFRGRRGGGS